MNPPSFSTPECFCPKCGYSFNHTSNLTGKGRPKPGDITLCMRCGQILLFRPDLTVELAADEQAVLAELKPEARRKLVLARFAIILIGPLVGPETKH
jgi:hypothetical protein